MLASESSVLGVSAFVRIGPLIVIFTQFHQISRVSHLKGNANDGTRVLDTPVTIRPLLIDLLSSLTEKYIHRSVRYPVFGSLPPSFVERVSGTASSRSSTRGNPRPVRQFFQHLDPSCYLSIRESIAFEGPLLHSAPIPLPDPGKD